MNSEGLRTLLAQLPVPPGGVAADLATGQGRVVSLLREAGWDVVGCEMEADRVAMARERGAAVDLGDVRTWEPRVRPQLVTCIEIIEHLPPEDQQPLLERVRGWLEPDGTLILSTPQRHSVVSLLERPWSRLRGRSYNWWDPAHISILRRRDLLRMLDRAGFDVVDMRGVHLVSDLVHRVVPPAARLANTVHRAPVGWLAFDLIIMASPR